MVEPRMFMVSREMVSLGALRVLVVILTALRAVFICGETEVMVPLTMVPKLSVEVKVVPRGANTIFELDGHALVHALHQHPVAVSLGSFEVSPWRTD